MTARSTRRSSLAAAALLGFLPAAERPSAGCGAGDPPEYYAIDLVTTRLVPGTGQAEGRAEVVFARTPFGVDIAPDGSFRYEVRVQLQRIPAKTDGQFVAWVTTPQVDSIRRIGPLNAEGAVRGTVAWNKFLVVVTFEATGTPADAPRWSGPIAFRGMSRSGRMHTMAGHGPFQQERCATYGY